MFPLKLEDPIVVFDIETTGLSPRKDRIVELAAIRVAPDGTETEQCWLLNPTIPIPPETTAIHGITDEIVRDCPTFAEKAQEIFEFFRGATLSGFNADRFDILCLEEEFARAGLNLGASSRKHLDVMRIYHKMEPRDLTAAVRFYLGRDHAGAHGAEADARATFEVLKAQLAKYPDLPKTDVEMDEYLLPHDPTNVDRMGLLKWKNGDVIVNFGKKKGESLRKLLVNEPNFLRWIIKGDFDTEVRMVARDLLENGRLPTPPKTRPPENTNATEPSA